MWREKNGKMCAEAVKAYELFKNWKKYNEDFF